jgi:hypothetical protein
LVVENVHLGSKTVAAAEVGPLKRDDQERPAYAHQHNLILFRKDRGYLDGRKHPSNRCPAVVALDIEPLTRDSTTDAL